MANQKISARTTLAGTGLISVPVVRAGSTTDYRLIHNLSASADPTVSDDTSAGYAAGSLWLRTDTSNLWVCSSASAGAAVWVPINAFAHPGYVANRYYAVQRSHASIEGNNTRYNAIGFVPVVLPQTITISELVARVTAASAGGAFQMAVYDSDPVTKKPTGPALGSTGNGSTTSGTTTVAVALSANVQLKANHLYYFALNCDNATATFLIVTREQPLFGELIGAVNAVSVASGLHVCGYGTSQTFGTWPDVTAASFNEGTIAAIAFKVASVP